MNRQTRFASYIGIILFSAFGLMACNKSLIKPDNVPTPPRVSCNAGPAATIPPIPPLAEMDEWAVRTMGVFEREVRKRAAEHKCIDDLKARGVLQ